MQILRAFIIASIMLVHYENQAQSNDIDSFLNKFEEFTTRYYSGIKWAMPLIKPENSFSSMPNAINTNEVYMEDPGTGLRIFPHLKKVYDPKTGYSVDYDPEIKYRVDVNARKIYKSESEVKIDRHQ